jgi:hypothetical protein
MKGCANWKDAVADCALGVAQSPAFAGHLARCPGCAEALRESQAAATKMLAALDCRVAAEPPLYGPERVMARIGRRKPALANRWWRWTLAACAMAVVMAVVLWSRRPIRQADVSALAAPSLASWHSPTGALLQPPVGAAWNTMPRLGEVFFEVKPSGETHAQ